MLRATTACTFSTSQLPKVVRSCGVLYILTSKCASRHNGVHFFNISTSKSGPGLRCFVHFDFQMCFAPQRRALFQHRKVQKWSAHVLSILTWKCASRHNGVQFFISHLASCLRTHRFSEPTFRPTGATNHWKNTVFRDFPTFSRICIFFLLILSLLTLLTSAFQLSILSEVSLLNFLRLKHIKTYQNHFTGKHVMGPMETKSCLCLGCSSMAITGYTIGIHRLPVPSRLWQVHYTFNLRDFAKIIFGVLLMKKQDGAKHRATWTLVLTRWSKCHRQHVNVKLIVMPHMNATYTP